MKTYIGKACKRGHTERYITDRKCAVCIRDRHAAPEHLAVRRMRASIPKNRVKHQERLRARRVANLESIRQKERSRRGLPAPTRPRPDACECCGNKGAVSLDHCHVTNIFRGWLCGSCNRGLGLLGDDVEGVTKILEYLLRVTS